LILILTLIEPTDAIQSAGVVSGVLLVFLFFVEAKGFREIFKGLLVLMLATIDPGDVIEDVSVFNGILFIICFFVNIRGFVQMFESLLILSLNLIQTAYSAQSVCICRR
jgi:hypothetical protein